MLPTFPLPPGFDFAAWRDWAVPAAADLNAFPTLSRTRSWSRAVLARLREALADLDHNPHLVTVAVSGSLGRLEAAAHSDADLIVVVNEPLAPEPAAALMGRLWDALDRVGLPRPKPTGIYATPAARADLCSRATLGRVAEDVPTFGKRIQLLLDAQPVVGVAGFAALVRDVVERYAAGSVGCGPGQTWTYLLHDLVRYYRSLCVADPWNFSTGKGGWYARNAKLGHSRLLLYAGLLLLLGESGRGTADPRAWLLARLPLTPLERVAHVYAAHGDPHFTRVADAYERFLAALTDPAARAVLAAAAPAAAGELADPPALFRELQDNARRLRRELSRFVLARREVWGERFLDELLW